jgi:hypothetical protein
MNLAHDEKDAKGDTARLEWVMRHLDKATSRSLVGVMSKTASIEELRVLIDWRMDSEHCDRCGEQVMSRTRTALPTEYQGCDVCAACLEELEPGRARATPPSTGEKPAARPLTRCAAGRDGDCSHERCPQNRDGEPLATGRHCPIDRSER